jgi:hypothetical protein
MDKELTTGSCADVAVDDGVGSGVRVLDEGVDDPSGQAGVRTSL